MNELKKSNGGNAWNQMHEWNKISVIVNLLLSNGHLTR